MWQKLVTRILKENSKLSIFQKVLNILKIQHKMIPHKIAKAQVKTKQYLAYKVAIRDAVRIFQ